MNLAWGGPQRLPKIIAERAIPETEARRQAASEYEFVVSNKSAPRYLSLALRRSRLRNSIKTSVHATPAMYRSSEMLGRQCRVGGAQRQQLPVAALGAGQCSALGARQCSALGAGTKTELIPVTFPNRAN